MPANLMPIPPHAHSVPETTPPHVRANSTSALGALLSYWRELGSNSWDGIKSAQTSVALSGMRQAASAAWHTSWIRAPKHSFQLVAYSEGPYAEHLKRHPVMRVLLDPDYKTQLVGRWGVQVGIGIGYGVSALILGMSGSMGASQGMLAADLMRGLELLLHQGSSLWRGHNTDNTRRNRETAERQQEFRVPRHRYVCALDTAWVFEVLLSATLIGVALGRQSAMLSMRGLIMMLALIRAARVVTSQSQYAQFDSLRETVRSAETRSLFADHQMFLRNLEQVIGIGINYAVGIGVQALPALVPCPALLPVYAGLLGVGVAISFLSKQPARRYYQERFEVPRPQSGSNTPTHQRTD